MQSSKKVVLIVSVIFLLLIISSFASASIIDWLKKIVTGKATSIPYNVSVPLVGANSVKIMVWNQTLTGGAVDPIENSTRTIQFNVTVVDQDGNADINDTSVVATLYASGTAGEVVRTNLTAYPGDRCVSIGVNNATSENYTCGINMWYYDLNVSWTINVTANDMGNKTYINDSTKNLTYGYLGSFILDPILITWPSIAPGDVNKTSAQNSTLNNSGNQYIIPGNIKVTAIDLRGITTTTQFLNASNFTASWNGTGGANSGVCNNATGGAGTKLVNVTAVGIGGANLTKGNQSIVGADLAHETIYYCIPQVPMLVSQTYASNTTGAWLMGIQT